MRYILFLATLVLLCTSCDEKFNSKRWQVQDDLQAYPHRKAMLDDIIKSRSLVGMKYKQVVDSLGEPSLVEGREVRYNIETRYRDNLDPVYIKDLVLFINADSVVTQLDVSEQDKS